MASKRKDKIPSKNLDDNPEILKILQNLFGEVLHVEVIKSIALNCHWDLETAGNILAELSSSVANNKIKKPDTNQKKKNASTVSGAASFAAQQSNFGKLPNTNIFSPVNSLNVNKPNFSQVLAAKSQNNPAVKKPKPAVPKTVQNKSKRELEYDRIVNHIDTGAKVLVLLRGLPGSGKSFIAKKIISATINEDPHRFIFSTDEYFERGGVYTYNPNCLNDAHLWNQKRVFNVMHMGLSPIIVDNTNTEMWEMKPYAAFAIQYGYAVEILEPNTSWIFNPPELARRNTHGVPKEKIVIMLERYEKNITPIKLFENYNLQYRPDNKPPQPRFYPPLSKNKNPPLLANIPPEILRMSAASSEVIKNELYSKPNANSNNGNNNNNNNNSASELQPKKKRERKRKKKTNGNGTSNATNSGQNSDSASTLSKSESMHSILSDDDSESDIDTLNDLQKTESGYKLLNSLAVNSTVKKAVNYYDYLGTSNESSAANVVVDDLINFNDDVNDNDTTDKKSNFTDDLICIENKENVNDTNSGKKFSNVQQTTAELIDSCVRLFNAVTVKNSNSEKVNTSCDYQKIDLTSWGLTEDSFKSWEVVDTTKEKKEKEQSPQPQREIFRQQLSLHNGTSDIGTNTCSEDFNMLKQDIINDSSVKVLSTIDRDISENFINNLPKHSVNSNSTFDKSTMTGSEYILAPDVLKHRCRNVEQHLNELTNLFPSISREVLRDILEKCKGDINWAVDLLLDDNKKALINENVPSEHDVHIHTSECTCGKEYDTTVYLPPVELGQEGGVLNVDAFQEQRKTPARLKPKLTEQTLELKKQIEEQFKLDYNYSEHVANLRKKRHGEFESLPSTSKENQPISPETLDENIDDNSSDESLEEEFLEMNVGVDFIEQLEKSVGNEDLAYPKGFQPVLQLPSNFVRQLHAYWLESVYQQMEAQQKIYERLEREDEEFAKKLQEEERKLQSGVSSVSTPNFQEIMDMEIALAIYKADVDQWRNETPDDLAFRMKKQKLFETFPTFDQDTLMEILKSCENSFEQTVEVLRASFDESSPIQVTASAAKQKELFENAKKAQMEANKIQSDTATINTTPANQQKFKGTAAEYREEAQMHMDMRLHNFQKAKDAMQKGQTAVALYYSEIAQLHSKKYEQANSLAAVAFLASQSTDSKTLDLHFLLGKESEQAVSVFIDEQISKLRVRNKPKDCIFIITGWGKHSKNGAVIKPIIMSKLRKRGLRFTQINPGLLKVFIRKNSFMTTDIE